MKAVRNLFGLRGPAPGGIGVDLRSITAHHLDLRLRAQPRGARFRAPISQQVHRPARFKINQDGAVALPAPPGPIINAEQRGGGCGGTPSCRSVRSTVSPLAAMPSRAAARAPPSPPSATPSHAMVFWARALRRAYRGAVIPNGSANVPCAQLP
jgi:hypothetical protein